MPRVLTPDDQQELKTLRDFFDPQKSADRLDSYGKWIFTAVASITALGTGLSNTAFQNLHSWGKIIYGFAVLAGGISLAAAALLLTPQLSNVNRWSMDSMLTAIDHVNKNRRTYVLSASWTLALALGLAAFAPIVSARHSSEAIVPTDPEIIYSFAGNKISVTASLSGLLSGSNVSVEVKRIAPSPEALLGRAVIRVNEKGVAKTTIDVVLLNGGTLQISYAAINSDNSPRVATQQFACEVVPK
jgi:hypothetical protein